MYKNYTLQRKYDYSTFSFDVSTTLLRTHATLPLLTFYDTLGVVVTKLKMRVGM